MGLSELLNSWRNDSNSSPNISTWRVDPARAAILVDFPSDLPTPLAAALRSRGLYKL